MVAKKQSSVPPILLTQHRILRTAWLPRCQAIYAQSCGSGKTRPLRYLSVYEADPQDVFLIKKAGLIPVDQHGYVGTYLFNRQSDPGTVFGSSLIGAVELAGDFLWTLLVKGPNPENKGHDRKEDTAGYQEWKQTSTRYDSLKGAFPFDAISLDLDDAWSGGKDDLSPGRLIRGLTRVLEWQRDSFFSNGDSRRRISQFKLCLTVRKPGADEPPRVKKVCRDAVSENLRVLSDAAVQSAFLRRSGGRSVTLWAKERFDNFAGLAAPKTILGVFRETGWDVEIGTLINIYEYSAGRNRGEKITLVADLCRHPTHARRHNGLPPGYLTAAEQIFRTSSETIGQTLVYAETTDYLDSAAVKNEAALAP